jgi:hypothetical protein
MDTSISLKDGYSIELDAVQHNFNVKVTYQFINTEGKKAKRFQDVKDPLELGMNSNIGKELSKHIDDGYNRKRLEQEFEKTVMEISEFVEQIIVAKNEAEEILSNAEAEVKQDEIDEGFETLENTESPLLWIANHIDWYTAGERMNILYAFIAYCSQVILRNPISVIAIGEGGSGKTHIEDVALSMIPTEYVITIKSTTDAALFGFCDTDPWYFDGKIVNIGDMGGKKDHEEAQNFKDAMKELQSDGYMARVKQVPKPEGGYENHTFELHGFPCLTYTNVPGHIFDDQELSRSILLTPRDDNNKAYMVFKRLYSQKNTPSAKLIAQKREAIPKIQKMVLALRHRMEDVEIYNPYWSFIETFLKDTKFLKRDVDKYDGILRVITCLNGYNRDLHLVGENKTLFTTKEDIMLFMDLLERYYESITINLSPGASDLLDDLRTNDDKWGVSEEGISVNDYLDKSGSKISKRSLRQYFSELNGEGLVKVVDNVRRANVYSLVNNSESLMKKDIILTPLDVKVLKFNYNIEDVRCYEGGSYLPLTFTDDANQPLWNDYLEIGDDLNGDASSRRVKNESITGDVKGLKSKNNENNENPNGDAVLKPSDEEGEIEISSEFDAFRED